MHSVTYDMGNGYHTSFKFRCYKGILITFNSLFLLSGAALLAIGLWMHFDKQIVTYLHLFHTTPSGPLLDHISYVFIGVGGFVFVVGFLGCCGACCESICMLCLYAVTVFICLAAEITAAVLVVIFKEKIQTYVQASMLDQVKHKYNRSMNSNNTDLLTVAWDSMQVKWGCCGSKGPQDYHLSLFFNTTNDEILKDSPELLKMSWSELGSYKTRTNKGVYVPATCCVLTNEDPKYPQAENAAKCQLDALAHPETEVKNSMAHTKGCYQALHEFLDTNLIVIIILASIIAVLQMLGLIVSCCLMCAIRREESKYPWYVDDDDE